MIQTTDRFLKISDIDINELNKYSPIPIYHQISLILEKSIIKGNISTNSYLPSEEELAEYFEVSRPTINKAINLLIKKSIIYTDNKKRRRYIKERHINLLFLNELESFGKELDFYKISHKTKVLKAEEIVASKEIVDLLEISKKSKVYFLKRLRFIREEPIILVNNYLPKKLFPGLLKNNFVERDLYEILRNEYGVLIKQGKRKVKATKASSEEANYLNIPIGEPILNLESIVTSVDGKKIEYFESKLNGEKVALITTVYPPSKF